MEQQPEHVRELDKIGRMICKFAGQFWDEEPQMIIIRAHDALISGRELPGEYFAHIDMELIETLTHRSFEPSLN